VYQVSAVNSTAFPEALALGTINGVTIGNIDDIQRLHIQTIPLRETPRRINFQEASRTFLLATAKYHTDARGFENETYSVRLLDCLTYETLDVFQMSMNEAILSLESVTFAEDETTYYVVGTTFVLPTEDEPSRGRLLVMQAIENRQLRQIYEYEIKGAPYQLCAFNGKLLVAYNNRVSGRRLPGPLRDVWHTVGGGCSSQSSPSFRSSNGPMSIGAQGSFCWNAVSRLISFL
jgi:DNA damage-binding protein 1